MFKYFSEKTKQNKPTQVIYLKGRMSEGVKRKIKERKEKERFWICKELTELI